MSLLLVGRDVCRRSAVPLMCMQETEQGTVQPSPIEEPHTRSILDERRETICDGGVLHDKVQQGFERSALSTK